MAFMVPVMKKEFDIYKTGRSRRASECSSSNASCRSRKISECRSDCPSLSTSPGSDYIGHATSNGHGTSAAAAAAHRQAAAVGTVAGGGGVGAHRSHSIPVHRNLSRTMILSSSSASASRPSSRTSQSSLIMSGSSPSKQPASMSGCSPPKPTSGSHGSLNKFHQRLVDKLRKSLRKARSEDRS